LHRQIRHCHLHPTLGGRDVDHIHAKEAISGWE
jgi:hypothetical protein